MFEVKDLKQEKKYLNEFQATCTDKQWKDIINYLHIILKSYLQSHNPNIAEHEDIIALLKKLNTQTDDEYIRMETLRSMTLHYWNMRLYELAFETSVQLCKSIENMPDTIYPNKETCYYDIAEKYYHFKEYDSAIVWYNKTFDVNSYKQNILNIYNGLGLCYCSLNNLGMSNFYFNKMLSFSSDSGVLISDIWYGIAKGNLGYNLYLEEKYDEAIPLLEFSLKTMIRHEDFAFASGTAIDLANIYLKKKSMQKAYSYGNMAMIMKKR